MMRLAGSRSWQRGPLQVGLLAALGLVFVGGGEPVAASPCDEDNCNIRAVRLMFALEYSTAMNLPFDADTTRLEKAVESIEALVDLDNGFLGDNFVFGLVRFGSDPDPDMPDTPIPGDVTGLRDGVRLDVAWYDELDANKTYVQCTDVPLMTALAGLPAPVSGIGSWTKGALEFSEAYFAKSEADHPQELGERGAAILLFTAGTWTDRTGDQELGPAADDPKSTASALAGLGVPTYVVNVGGAQGKLIADPLAQAGGTGQARDVDDLPAIVSGFKDLLAELTDAALVPVCEPSSPRVMIVLDAASATLNVDGAHARPGASAWDQVREALAGDAAVLRTVVGGDLSFDSVARFGLVASGGADPTEQTVVVQYGYCPTDRIAWGLDPTSSCVAPGCVDPYAPPAIAWTSQNGGQIDPPGFDQDVPSHMPRCDLDPQTPAACTGSGRFTHLGLLRAEANLAAYRAQCLAPGSSEPCNADTPFVNLLITDGPYDSTDAQVEARLVALFESGVVTRVFGIGDAVDAAQVETMAGWGSGGAFAASFAADGDELAADIAELLVPYIESLTFDECCSFDHGCDDALATDAGSTTGDSDESGSDTGGSSGTTGAGEGTGGLNSGTATTGAATTGATGEAGSSGAPDPSGTTGPGAPPTSTSGVPPTSATSSETGESQIDAPDAGCACAAGEPGGQGLLVLGLAGLLRRRSRGRRGAGPVADS